MRRLVVVLVLVAAGLGGILLEKVYTRRTNNYIREGPGASYALIAVVPENTALTVIERSEKWVKISLSDRRTGWMASNCLTDSKPPDKNPMPVENIWSSPKASKAGVSAAIRGFAQRFGDAPPGSVESVLAASVKTFTPADLQAFAAPVLQHRQGLAERMSMDDLKLPPAEYDGTLSEQQVGLGVAARLAATGLRTDSVIVRYVNMLTATVAASSPSYDWDFTVFILRQKTVNAWALPGGMIFVTEGVLRLCADESELAALLAHELAHVIRRHGLQEMTERLATIKSDEAFNELEEEIGEPDAEEQDLQQLMRDAYERVIARRLLAYELEADRIAAVLLARSGYDPYALIRLSDKVASLPRERQDLFDPDYLAPDDATTRARAIAEFVGQAYPEPAGGTTMKERFVALMRSLQ
jgi:hypothetical protein